MNCSKWFTGDVTIVQSVKFVSHDLPSCLRHGQSW